MGYSRERAKCEKPNVYAVSEGVLAGDEMSEKPLLRLRVNCSTIELPRQPSHCEDVKLDRGFACAYPLSPPTRRPTTLWRQFRTNVADKMPRSRRMASGKRSESPELASRLAQRPAPRPHPDPKENHQAEASEPRAPEEGSERNPPAEMAPIRAGFPSNCKTLIRK